MNKLKSKFSLKQVVVIPIIISMIVGLLILLMAFLSFEMVEEGTPLYKTPIWASLLFGFLLFFSFYYYLKIFKKYKFDEKGIHVSNIFGKQFYSWNIIRDIKVLGKEYEVFLWQYLNEDASTIQLKNGEEIVLFSKYYQNMPKIRRYLKSKTNQIFDKQEFEEDCSINNSISYKSNNIQFKGNYFLKFKSIVIYGLALMFFLILINRFSSFTLAGLIIFIAFPIFLILAMGFQLYFFELKNEYLYIKNHLPLFKSKKYKLSDIKNVYIEMDYKKSHKMRIFTNDFESKTFMADSLRDIHWKQLIESLKERKIEVIDELFFE